MSSPFTTSLGSRQLIQIYDPSNVTNTYSPKLNPIIMTRKPGNVRKYMMTTNGASVILGQREYPPSEITLEWKQMDISDFNSLKLMTYISPTVLVDNNDNGFLGVLCITEAQQIAGLSLNVWSVKASFLVLGPYNGQHTTLNTLAVPTLSISTATTGGYIPASTTMYFWQTVFTSTGESTVGSVSSITTGSGTATNTISLSWTPPTSTSFVKSRLYWYTANTPSSATKIAEVLSGQSGTWSTYGPYFQYSYDSPPTYNSAFTGDFAGATWVQGV